jgi:3-phosphoshikimate 1-carboxyvinyltransferase
MHLTARPSGPLTGRVRPPGDKSISHRALLFGALAEGATEIDGLLEGDDVLRTAAAMAAFGAPATRSPDGRWTIRGRGREGFAEPAGPIDFGNSGTGVRLTMGAAGRFPLLAVYTGDQSLSGRPMRRVLEPLSRMGVESLSRTGGLLPAAVRGKAGLSALSYDSPTASAQVKSAVLLAGLGAEGITSVTEPAPSRDHTERMLTAFGASVRQEALPNGQARASVTGGATLIGQRLRVPADPSSAAFLAVAALICEGSEVFLTDVCLNPHRAGLYQTLADMGAELAFTDLATTGGEPTGTLHLKATPGLKPARPPAERMPAMIDEVPILAIAAAFAHGETIIVGAEELRVKESDRIALTVAGLRACGVEAEERPDGLMVRGRGPGSVPGGALVETHGDHRIAMSFLVLGLAAQAPVTVNNADMIATSFPGFAPLLASLGAEIEG